MATIKLTEAELAKIPLPTTRAQEWHWDTTQGAPSGFGVVVSSTGRKTFLVRTRPAEGGNPVKKMIGVAGQPRGDGHVWTVKLARIAAADVHRDIRNGVAPADRRAPVGGPTLRKAIELHVKGMHKDEKQPRSIEEFERETNKHLADWLDRPLASITRTACRELHEQLTDASGLYLANRVLRYVRAAWNTMLKEQDIPANPTIAVQWNKEHRRQEPVPWTKLADVYSKIEKLESGVRRDYYLTLMLTGLRKMDAATMRWDLVNLTDEAIATRTWDARREKWVDVELSPFSLLCPNPKGGKERAFTLPLSPKLIEILEQRRADNRKLAAGDGGWVFPTETWKEAECHECAALGQPAHAPGAPVHLIEPREDDIPSPHRWRDTYTSALAALDPPVSPYMIDVLTNHRPPKGSVTAGYIDLGIDDLARVQSRVTEYLLERAKPDPKAKRAKLQAVR